MANCNDCTTYLSIEDIIRRSVKCSGDGHVAIIGSKVNQVPEELSDTANNYGHYIFDDASNRKDTSNLISQLRDLNQSNAVGADAYGGTGVFDSDTGWALAAGWSVSGGKLNGAPGSASNALRTTGGFVPNAIYKFRVEINTLSGSSVGPVNMYTVVGTPAMAAGTWEHDLVATTIYGGLRKNSASTVVADNLTANRIAGNHLTGTVVGALPLTTATDITFNGTDEYLLSAAGAAAIGSIYIVAQRVGTDEDYVVLNSLAGIGEYAGNSLYIGRNAAGSSYYNVKIKEIFIRLVNDSEAVQSKINAYFEKKKLTDGYLTPMGKTISPATNPEARQFLVSLCDDDAGENGYNIAGNSALADYPHLGGFFTRFYPTIKAANDYLVANNVITPEQRFGVCECVYLSRLTLNNGPHVWLKYLQDNHGWEVANHSASHFGYSGELQSYIESVKVAEITDAHDTLENTYGFNIDTFVWPFGTHSHILREEAKIRHKAGICVGGTFKNELNHNMPPLNHMALTRHSFDNLQYIDAAGNVTNPAAQLAFYKARVDEAKAANGWLIFMSHCSSSLWKNYNALFIDEDYPAEWILPFGADLNTLDWSHPENLTIPAGWYPYPNSSLAIMYEVLLYIYSEGGKIVLPRDGIDLYGNISTVGDPTWGVKGINAADDALNYDHKAIGIDGSVSAYRSS